MRVSFGRFLPGRDVSARGDHGQRGKLHTSICGRTSNKRAKIGVCREHTDVPAESPRPCLGSFCRGFIKNCVLSGAIQGPLPPHLRGHMIIKNTRQTAFSGTEMAGGQAPSVTQFPFTSPTQKFRIDVKAGVEEDDTFKLSLKGNGIILLAPKSIRRCLGGHFLSDIAHTKLPIRKSELGDGEDSQAR
jgi:hypothetical protein